MKVGGLPGNHPLFSLLFSVCDEKELRSESYCEVIYEI